MLDFLCLTFPDDLEPVLGAASPILYRCIIACGSFPWQNEPMDKLTSPVIQAAVVFLTCRGKAIRFEYGGDNDESPNIRLVLFQSIATVDRPLPTYRNQALRTKDDDYHLLAVMHVVRYSHNTYSPKGKPECRITPLPSAAEFPSSWSRALDRRIPAREFFSLLKLLVGTRLFQDGIGPEVLAKHSTVLEEVTTSVFNAFQLVENFCARSAPDTATTYLDISWETFDYVILKYTVTKCIHSIVLHSSSLEV